MMRTIKVIIIAILMVIPILGYAQQNSSASSPLAYLEKTFPKLTNLYREELSKYPAHYIFAIDVSGTMNQYEDMVVNSIVPFFSALPDGDRVDIIPFGTEALSPMSYSGIIDSLSFLSFQFHPLFQTKNRSVAKRKKQSNPIPGRKQ